MCVLSDRALAALNRMDEIANVWQALGDLMMTDNDAIQHRQRDNLACVMDFLQREYHDARNTFSEAARDGGAPC